MERLSPDSLFKPKTGNTKTLIQEDFIEQDIPITHNFKPIGLCRIEVINKKFFIGHFTLSVDLKGNEYMVCYFEMETVNGNELRKIDFSDLYIPASPLMTVHDMVNAKGGERK